MHLNTEREFAGITLSNSGGGAGSKASFSLLLRVCSSTSYQLILVADLTQVIISVSQYLYILSPSHSATQIQQSNL